jgi:hypothetical protein
MGGAGNLSALIVDIEVIISRQVIQVNGEIQQVATVDCRSNEYVNVPRMANIALYCQEVHVVGPGLFHSVVGLMCVGADRERCRRCRLCERCRGHTSYHPNRRGGKAGQDDKTNTQAGFHDQSLPPRIGEKVTR